MDPIKSGSDDNSIEEEIEEVITDAEEAEDSSLVGSKPLAGLINRQRQIFNIDQEEDDDGEFKIDDADLSGGNLMQHFKAEEEEGEDEEEKENDGEGGEASLTNQSTANDVSEMFDESSLHVDGTKEDNSEKDHSVEEIMESNHSIEVTIDDKDLSALNPSFDIDNESQVDKILSDTTLKNEETVDQQSSSVEEDMEALRQKIIAMKQSQRSVGPNLTREVSFEQNDEQGIVVKQMERVQGEFTKEVLEDITEESEKCSTARGAETDFDSVVSLNMIQMLEGKIKDLQEVVASKDVCLAAMTMQLEANQRRESSAGNLESLKELPPSGRESCSLVTTSTEYRTLDGDFMSRGVDFHTELTQRDLLIEKLTDSLQQSMQIRESLQSQSEKLTSEVQQLRKQLTEALEAIKKPYWPRDQESTGQRISEISIDLVSESDDDLDRNFLTDNEDKISRHSRERQLSMPRSECADMGELDLMPVSKQIEQFQKYLAPDEVRIFFMIQKKFDDFLSQELEKNKKALTDQMEAEKHERENEINRLRQLLTNVKNGSTEVVQLREELEAIHSKEMEDLRQYFEKKCADLEKQYSEEIFSQKSQRNDSGSDISDQENLPDEGAGMRSKESSPRKRTREELYASPSHRQLTPNHEMEDDAVQKTETIEELRIFYQNKISALNKSHEDAVCKLNERLKRFESKCADDEFMPVQQEQVESAPLNVVDGTTSTSLIIIDEDEITNENQVIQKIIAEYERRLKEQVALAKEDILRELENQIQALLSETTTDDHHWPPELILLREKFTAKSQLEIAQLQIKHEEEMSRLRADFDKQMNRKVKRQSTFDQSRDLDQLINERDGLRELSNTFRYVLAELAKCVTVCEDDLNATFLEEIQKASGRANETNLTIEDIDLNNSILNSTNQSVNQLLQTTTLSEKRLRFAPDVSGLLSLVESPSLIEFISERTSDKENFNLKDCLEKLRTEANCLLALTENLNTKQQQAILNETGSTSSGAEKNDSCEEEDGLKRRPGKFNRANSLNENLLRTENKRQSHILTSLPPDLNRVHLLNESILEDFTSSGTVSELNFQVHELKNRLVKSENDRLKLQDELQATISKNSELGVELNALKEQLEQLDSQREDYSEGYSIGLIKSPRRNAKRQATSFGQLQEKARNLLSTPIKTSNEDTTVLLQMIEDFCREGDKVVESNKKDREDLQAQVEQLEQQIKDLTQQCAENQAKRDKFEIELKASIDKIFVLREIISELETQVETKALNEHVLNEKLEHLETYINSQNHSNIVLQQEVESLKTEIGPGYQERISHLEEQLRNARPSAEQSMIFDQIVGQLRDIETALDQKTKTLESLHQAVSSVSCSTSPAEDVSVQNKPLTAAAASISPAQGSPVHPSPRQPSSLPTEDVQRVLDKLAKHSRAEEAAIKRIRDLEMQVFNIRASYSELQNERDILQERMSEQMSRISALQYKLEEQRHRAEVLQRAGTSDLNIRIHDLQSEIANLKETLTARDKQILNLKNNLEQSKAVIDRQEVELAAGFQGDRNVVEKLESELRAKREENQKLKDKIKNEMINKLALPDLMETMLADKNEEIDHLKEQLDSKDKEIQEIFDQSQRSKGKDDGETKLSARTLSDIVSISEYDEPDVIRRAQAEVDTPLVLPDNQFFAHQGTMESSKEAVANLTEKRTGDLTVFTSLHPASTFDHPHYFQDPSIVMTGRTGSTVTPSCVPRQINFSEFEDSRLKESTPKASLQNSELLALRERLQTAQSESESLKMKLEEVEREKAVEVDNLRKDLKARTLMYEELLKEKESADLKINELSAEIEKLKEIELLLKARESECEKLSDKLVSHELRLAQLTQEMEEKISENTKLQDAAGLSEDLIKEKNSEISKLEKNLSNFQQNEKNHLKRISELEEQISVLSAKVSDIESCAPDSLKSSEIETVRSELISARNELAVKIRSLSEITTNLEKAQEELTTKSAVIERLREDLNSARSELSEKVLLHEKAVLDIQVYTRELESLKNMAGAEKKQTELCELKSKVSEQEEQIAKLEKELERLRSQQNSESSKPFSLDEIAEQVEKELNYSAQLDSNILKAIESEDENNLEVKDKTDSDISYERDLLNQIETLRAQLDLERENCEQYRQELGKERLESKEIQEQDVAIIEAMRLRLEEALSKEQELHQMIDEQREKCERLSTQISILQRTEARKSSLLLKSPPDSPRKSPRSSDFESELVERLKSEIKLLTAQNERERERVADLQKNLERERSRFETELNDRIEYSEKLSREMDKVARDKDLAEQDAEHLQERLTVQAQEIQSLEARIAALQEAETRRATRRDRERTEITQNAVELQELRAKLADLEKERDHLNQTVALLRGDIERGAQREVKLADALANAGSDDSIPKQFLQKMKEMSSLIAQNTKENGQMAETVQLLIDERRALQRRCEELESHHGSSSNVTELEERANHLLGKYLRVESHRKALVHQKRYLLISLQSYQDNEARAMERLGINRNLSAGHGARRRSLKTVALAVIAIQRMKFIVRRWQTGKRIVSKSVFTITQQKRSPVAAPSNNMLLAPISTSPPCRDTTPQHSPFNLMEPPHISNIGRPLQAPGLISDCVAQKFDWSRLKK